MKNLYIPLLKFMIMIAGYMLAVEPVSSQVVITQWTFEGDVLTPSTGNGTAVNTGGTSSTFASGFVAGRGWNTAAYPAQNTNSGTAGVRFSVATDGYSNIIIEWNQRHSNTSANMVRLKYSLDGSTWIDFQADESNATNLSGTTSAGFDNGRFVANAGNVWFSRSANLGAIAGANNNPAFAVEIVSEFADGSNYVASNLTSTYGPSGTWRFDDVTFKGAGLLPTLIVNPGTLTGLTYILGGGPSPAQTYQLSGFNLEGAGNVSVSAPANYEISSDGSAFSASLSFPFSNGILTGQPFTIHVRLKAGLPAGSYANEEIEHIGGGDTAVVVCSGSVTFASQPSVSAIILPQYTQGVNVTNNTRVPLAYRLSLNNLLPNATYRYFNKVVVSTDDPTFSGAGNSIFISHDGVFTRTTSTSFINPGEYGELTTSATGSFTGWFITEPTANVRFTPGSELHIRISLNDGAGGNIVQTSLTTDDAVKVINFATTSADTSGTAFRVISGTSAKNIATVFDNADGSGRPLFATSIETTGVDFCAAASYPPFYCDHVQGVNGAFGGIVPNVNPNGIRRIEERRLSDGTIAAQFTSGDGVWGEVDTRNPNGGIQPLVLDIRPNSLPEIDRRMVSVLVRNRTVEITLPQSANGVAEIYDLTGRLASRFNLLEGLNKTQVKFGGGVYIVRVITGNRSYSTKVNID